MSYTGTQAVTGKGVSLLIGTTSPAATHVAEVRSLTQSGADAAEEDVTNLDSTAKEIITTIADEGTYDGVCNRVVADAGQQLIQANFYSAAPLYFKIVLPLAGSQTTTGDTYTGKCYVKSRNATFEPTKATQFAFKLRITGAVTFTAGS